MAEENLVEGIEADDVYVGNGVAREFPITFTFSNETEVAVFLNGQVIRRGYTITDNCVVFAIAPSEGDEVSILKIDLSGYIKDEEESETEDVVDNNTNVYDQASQEHVKINPVQTKVKYTGNGSVYEFPTIFAFFENDNVVVYLNGVILDSGYSVSGVGETDGGLVTFDVAPAEGDKIVILRRVAIERVTDFQEGGAFRAKNINDEFDRMTAFCQQIQEEIDRCVKVEVTDDQDPQELIDKVFDQLDLATAVGEQAIKTAEETQALVEGSKALIEEETQKAIEQLALSGENVVDKARIWAEGEQMEVEPLGGQLSSRGFANLAQAITNTPVDVPIDASSLLALDVIKGPKGDKGDKGEDGKDGGGLEIGDIAFAALGIDESRNLRRYLNGQVISQSQFQSFAKLVKERVALYPSLVATEENWKAEVTNSKLGQCGKFVIDDTLGTIRLPKVVNIQGLQDLSLLGGIKAESLPNIEGDFPQQANSENISGNAFYAGKTGQVLFGTSWGQSDRLAFDASRNSSTYQDNAPVQQEAIQYPYFIQVATGVEESVDVTREIELNNPFSLLDYKWSEYELNNASWLLSNGAFHSGTVYKSVYELLLKIKNGAETKDGVSVKLSTETYTDTDFVINTADTTFRLPIKVKLASGNAVVGNGMTLGMTDNTTYYGTVAINGSGYRAFQGDYNLYGNSVGSSGTHTNMKDSGLAIGVTTDPTKSGIETSSSGLKLYFYVGETVQDANVINAANILNFLAKLESYDYVVESKVATDDDPTWYRVYKSGWVEQGGYAPNSSSGVKDFTYLKPFINNKYYLSCSSTYLSNGGTDHQESMSEFVSRDSFGFRKYIWGNTNNFYWQACGQGA